jgi:signal transduction histidine kinase
MGTTVEQSLMARLARHRALGHAPQEEHAWLVAHGSLQTYEAGEVIMRKGERVQYLFVLFEGHIVIRTDRGAGAHTIFQWRGGDIGGAVPYSRGASPPADSVVEERTEMLVVPKETFPELTRECPVTTAALVHAMLDRARMFTSSDLRDEKLISLGKLSSGLAHELNNPASAVVRSAKMLAASLNASEEAARLLVAARLSEAQLHAIDATRALCVTPPPLESLSAVGRADREEAMGDWLRRHRANESSAGPLAETGVTLAALDALATSVSGDALDAALRWLAAGCQVRALSAEIENAGTRIYDLVAAVKGFSYMDRAPTAEPVDIRRGIADTLTMLGAKMRTKNVRVSVEVANDLPRAHAVGAELNQVWMNLLDNAIDAVPQGGHVTVSAAPELDRVSVRIIDDGPGIPPEIVGRIFDPFFTTKGVGQGSGLGLDIVRRLLQRQSGEISVESAPGRTEFQVRLPAES